MFATIRLAGVVLGALCAAVASAASPLQGQAAAKNDIVQDSIAIMAAVEGESTAYWNKDFDAWASHWVQAPYVRVMGWWSGGGVTVREGWDAIGSRMKRAMHENPTPNPTATLVRRANINLQVHGDVAWVTFDQFGLDTGDSRTDMPGLSRETRILQRQDGRWRIAYAGWLLVGE